jgi:BASS family bile acid:Na+ symporter
MSLAELVVLGLKASVALIVFGLAMKSTPGDLTSLLRRPSLLARSLLSINIIMPLVAAAIVSVLGLRHPVRIALMVLMISPVPPILPKRQMKLGGNEPYIFGLMVTEALLAVALVPLSVFLMAAVLGLEARMPWPPVAIIVLESILLPLGVGVALRHLAPDFAKRIEPIVSRVGLLLLIAGIAPILVFAGRFIIMLVGNGTLLATSVVVLLGLAVGHLLGGPEPGNRTVLALASAARHPGVAMAIASATFPDEKLVPAAILLYMLVNAILCIPYMKWIERRARPITTVAPVAPPHDKAA